MKNKVVFCVIAWLLTALFSIAHANEIRDIRVSTKNGVTRTVIDLSGVADFSYFTLDSPQRLVVDLKQTNNSATLPKTIKKSSVLSKIRKSTPPNSSAFRLVFELKKKIRPKLFKLGPEGQVGHRLVIDFPVDKPVAEKAPKIVPTSSTPPSRRDVMIVIDPGHGGKDPGSIGPSKRYEKHTTLSVSKKLVTRLNNMKGVQARLTRKGDYYIGLDKRVMIADKNNAHLFISIHADAFTSSKPRGASVFYLNERRANSELARWVENKERQSARLGGSSTVTRDDKMVNKTLLDLQLTNQKREGEKLAKEILGELKKIARLHKPEPSQASLAVLRSPNIPSVLVEMGFISNPTEETLLFQRVYQDKLANALTRAVMTYLKENPPEGTVFDGSSPSNRMYIVKRGDFLSKIAQQHGVSLQSLKTANKLKSDTVKVGQTLVIPGNSATSVLNSISTKVVTHSVKRGDYLGKLASQYKVSVASIKRANNLKSDTLRVGQKLKISVTTNDAPVIKHKVKRGEYLGKIASRYDIRINDIRKANNLRSDELAIGQTLIIPYQ